MFLHLLAQLQAQGRERTRCDLIGFGDDADIGFVELRSRLRVGAEHGLRSRRAQASDGAPPGVALF